MTTCLYCSNGDHEIPGGVDCSCACHSDTYPYFTISQVCYVPDGEGGVDRDDIFFPQRYSTVEEAVAVIRTLRENVRYIVDDHPRTGMFPAWKGWGGADAKNEYEPREVPV